MGIIIIVIMLSNVLINIIINYSAMFSKNQQKVC